ncbi:uncharacterized protein LAESUDRAFT_715756 [Laetiporus sulphureus 93-53]|uniref:Uncharacterized protein n=1 Tax=Laetiporus sulphureus 93-53 TaxID=1314785 RepID=A0A165D6A5_9APHY|nr:uncharacterized protein LAESUDRAFT_715756 [Laetiporus sulphureus 93-53]KZT04230.1 hypothetical protein LAESUDRAFT_715756 [Laetiporus sulphureus 93-53]
MITPPTSDEENAPQVGPREGLHVPAVSPSEWSDWEDDPASADDYQQIRPSSLWVMPTEGVYLGEGWSKWVKLTDDDGNFVSYWSATGESFFKDKSGRSKSYAIGPRAIRLMMPQPVPPRESFDAIRFGNWDCHEEDGRIVITRQPGIIRAPDNTERTPSVLQITRARSGMERPRQAPVGPRPRCFSKKVTDPSISSSKVEVPVEPRPKCFSDRSLDAFRISMGAHRVYWHTEESHQFLDLVQQGPIMQHVGRIAAVVQRRETAPPSVIRVAHPATQVIRDDTV